MHKMLINDELEKIQQLLKDNGFADSQYVKDIMAKNSQEVNNRMEYYSKMIGKCYKYVNNNQISYTKINSVHNYTNYLDELDVKVNVDRVSIQTQEKYTCVHFEMNYTLSSSYVGRYDKYIEITEEQYNYELQLWSDKMNEQKDLLNKLTNKD